MRSNREGFTYIELMIGLIIGAVLILMIGAISSIGNASFDKAMKESSVYNDAFSGLNLIKFFGRKSHTMITTSNASKFGLSPGVLELDNSAFGLGSNNKDFVYLNDKSKPGEQTVLIKDADVLTLTLEPQDSSSTNMVTVTLHVKKQKEDFDLSTSVMRRN